MQASNFRPDFRRSGPGGSAHPLLCLDGSWAFAFDDADVGVAQRWYAGWDEHAAAGRISSSELELELGPSRWSSR